MSTAIISPEIVRGVKVFLKRETAPPEWSEYYGYGPFRVCSRERNHLILEWVLDPLGRNKKGDIVHFGRANALVNVSFFGRWRWYHWFFRR